jgi:hypothetical protein
MPGIGSHTRPIRGATDDWITPPEITKALGSFDLDPCICDPQPFRTADCMWSLSDDGLSRNWFGRVWLNPPYGRKTGVWLKRLAEHGQGTALIFARTETEMFCRYVWEKASGLLFIAGRLHFYRPDGTRSKFNSGGPSVLIAYGNADARTLQAVAISGKINGSYVSLKQLED